jgi:hypothetical protein
VRFLTFDPGDKLDERFLVELIRESARVALLSRAERLAVALEAEIGPESRDS